MNIDFKKIVKPYIKDLYKSIAYFVAIPSVNDQTTANENMPYGKEIDHALKEFGKLGDMYGFDVDLSNRYCELSLGNKGHLIEVFGHLDVVPANKLKDREIFSSVDTGDKLLGRGVADDKGPLLACFYAIKALKDNSLIPDDVRIKIFAGGDEERGGTCLSYYVNTLKKEPPKYGFTPDSKFPLVYGEKAIGNIVINKNINLKNIISIKGGKAFNVVIPFATFKVNNINEIKDKISIPHTINNDEITFIGVSAHAANPKVGKNAFLLGLKELGRINNDAEAVKIAEAFMDTSGKNINAFYAGTHLKETTYNIGIVSYTNSNLELSINCRYPEDVDPKKLTQNIINTLGFSTVKENYSPYLLFALDSPFISSLLNAYYEESGDKVSKPFTAGGGTYAKEVKNTVAFGAEFPNIDYKMHQDDEFINKNELELAMAIYAHAIYNLIKLK